MKVQGVELATSVEKVKLPTDGELIEADGLLPEFVVDGVAHLIGVDGRLYPRVVNNGRHAAITIPPTKKEKRRQIRTDG